MRETPPFFEGGQGACIYSKVDQEVNSTHSGVRDAVVSRGPAAPRGPGLLPTDQEEETDGPE